MSGHPLLRQVVLDTTDARRLAEFYRQLLGFVYRTGDEQHRRALELGATLLADRSSDEEEPLRVYGDPEGHPFCIFVAAPPS